MAAGLPVIVTENTGAKQLIRDGLEGFIVPIRDAGALQEKLLWLYEHPQQRRAMGRAAARRVRQFTWERYRQRLLTVYDQILAREGLA